MKRENYEAWPAVFPNEEENRGTDACALLGLPTLLFIRDDWQGRWLRDTCPTPPFAYFPSNAAILYFSLEFVSTKDV